MYSYESKKNSKDLIIIVLKRDFAEMVERKKATKQKIGEVD